MSSARMLVGDVRKVLATIPDASVDLVLSSWPFLALRSYLPPDHSDKALEIGSEPTPAAYLDTLLGITAEFRRVLALHGSICLELGDTYSGSGGAGGDYSPGGLRDGQERFDGSASKAYGTGARARPARKRTRAPEPKWDRSSGRRAPGGQPYTDMFKGGGPGGPGWPLDKSLTLVPESYRWALAYGRNPFTGAESPAGMWRVRNVVDWCRPNPQVGALGDKVRPSTSDLVWACTARDRWFDLDAVRQGWARDYTKENPAKLGATEFNRNGAVVSERTVMADPAGAPPLDHWVIPPGGYSGAHYAVWPPELLTIPIEASCPRRVCRTCGQPSRRQTETEHEPNRNTNGSQSIERRWIEGGSPGYEVRADRRSSTTGWTSCGCPGTDGIRLDGFHTGTGWRPGHVLDPFGGSGTTALVATGHGRDCTLIDLDERNVDLARERLGMFLEVQEANDPYLSDRGDTTLPDTDTIGP